MATAILDIRPAVRRGKVSTQGLTSDLVRLFALDRPPPGRRVVCRWQRDADRRLACRWEPDIGPVAQL